MEGIVSLRWVLRFKQVPNSSMDSNIIYTRKKCLETVLNLLSIQFVLVARLIESIIRSIHFLYLNNLTQMPLNNKKIHIRIKKSELPLKNK